VNPRQVLVKNLCVRQNPLGVSSPAFATRHPRMVWVCFAGFIFRPQRMNEELLTKAKSLGFSDRQIAHLTGTTEDAVRAERKKLGLVPSYRLVDTCAAEF
jgi:hypothetical protein